MHASAGALGTAQGVVLNRTATKTNETSAAEKTTEIAQVVNNQLRALQSIMNERQVSRSFQGCAQRAGRASIVLCRMLPHVVHCAGLSDAA